MKHKSSTNITIIGQYVHSWERNNPKSESTDEKEKNNF